MRQLLHLALDDASGAIVLNHTIKNMIVELVIVLTYKYIEKTLNVVCNQTFKAFLGCYYSL